MKNMGIFAEWSKKVTISVKYNTFINNKATASKVVSWNTKDF